MGWTKIGTGTLNKSKDPSKGAPYYGKCKITLDGREFECSLGAWVKDGKDNSKFFSLSFSVQDDARPAPAAADASDSDIPF